jgi:serine/threonine-protein kinase
MDRPSTEPSEQANTGPDSIPFLVGTVFHDRYQVVRCISTGGMGGVYEAIHVETRRHCALKVMLPGLVRDPEMRARFSLECTVASNVESEHIVQVFDAGVDARTGLPFLVMELLKGEELFSMLERRNRLTPLEVVTFLYQASLALEKTHAAGIVHRDLKPENVFITTRDDGSPRVKILDFGIAKVISRQDRITSSFLGTPLYMAPEQLALEAEISSRTDTYALGQLAFAMLVGTPYWDQESAEEGGFYRLISKVSRGAIEPATVRAASYGAALPAAFDAWFEKATATDPKNRFARALNLVAALAPVLGVTAPGGILTEEAEAARALQRSSVSAVSAPQRMKTVSRPRSGWVWTLLLLVMAAIGIGVGILAFSRVPTVPPPARAGVEDAASTVPATSAELSSEAPLSSAGSSGQAASAASPIPVVSATVSATVDSPPPLTASPSSSVTPKAKSKGPRPSSKKPKDPLDTR